MYKPSDFGHWKYWVSYEWREWNPFHIARKIFNFATNILVYRKILWHDHDFDYYYLLDLMEVKLRRMSRHFAGHGIVTDSPRIARECLVAAELCRRINNDDYIVGQVTRESVMKGEYQRHADLVYLAHLMQRKLFSWWD